MEILIFKVSFTKKENILFCYRTYWFGMKSIDYQFHSRNLDVSLKYLNENQFSESQMF